LGNERRQRWRVVGGRNPVAAVAVAAYVLETAAVGTSVLAAAAEAAAAVVAAGLAVVFVGVAAKLDGQKKTAV
jgi:hypothetical protein